jgi:hypothetical protein
MVPNLTALVNDPHCYVWNPIGFNPREVLGPDLCHHGEAARYLLHLIHHGRVFKRNSAGYTQLKAEFLRPFFPNTYAYKSVRDRLIDAGLMACDERFHAGRKAYGYRIGEEWEDVEFERIEIEGRKLRAKIRESRLNWLRMPRPIHRDLFGWLCTMEIEDRAALDWLAKLPKKKRKPIHRTAVEYIRDGQFYLSACRFGRVHSNLTCLKSGLRQFLRCDGCPLVNLDIRNSQPLLLSLLMNERYGTDHVPPDGREYTNWCETGRFYPSMMELEGIPVSRRAWYKKRCFAQLFFGPIKANPHPRTRLFAERFPTPYSLIVGQKTPDYRNLAHTLQRAESDLMIGHIARRIVRDHPSAFIGTIHDSIVTTPEFADPVREIMLDEFRKKGLRPTINIEG